MIPDSIADPLYKVLQESIAVTRQKVTIAKAFILQNFKSDPKKLINTFLQHVKVDIPQKITLNTPTDNENVKKAAEAISWHISACEAIWGLISNNMIIPDTHELVHMIPTIEWSTGSKSAGWSIDPFSIKVPSSLKLSLLLTNVTNQPLSDPDLFIHTLKIRNIHPDVEESIREAVRCFKYELYLACLAMLGKASEIAWIEMGLKLIKFVPDGATIQPSKVSVQARLDGVDGIGKKMSDILRLYEHSNIFKPIYEKSGISIIDLKISANWSNCVRDSRNPLHHGFKSAMPNSYEKVAALLIGAVPHLRSLYHIEACL